ncbi:cellulase family glycosylhydrolase [Streptomyces paludis]|uniref:Endoglucanase n=1 Tax=Streptomyces paludis TaxID=2282738 RepID=A0A345HYA1_9ACTN|nr:cellulase family glycosylhydrolase [Streptomyces paludis]AXG81675.1 glycoside hydrolase family 5 protein [Streptomyces paludis]
MSVAPPHTTARPRRGRLPLLGLLLPLLALAGLLAVSLPAPAAQAREAAATGLRVSNGRLLEANGNEFVMRGVNHAHTWYTGRTTAALSDIKALGANTVRVVLSTGDQWTRNDTADVANIVAQCKQNKLICVLEAHDTTGYGEQSAAVTLSRAADYWISVQSALTGQESYVIVNIGNEPYGNTNYAGWTADTKAAIVKLRNAGFGHTLMVDAPNWGQDWSFTMRDNAASVFAADPDRNTMFSIHMYGVFNTAAKVSAYLNTFVNAGLPILVGEFGDMHSDGDPDEDAIMATTQSLRLGYLGWSWSGNSGGVEYLDMATGFNPNALSSWGQRIFKGANGIGSTSQQATVYGTSGGGGGGGGTTSACSVAYTVSGQWSGGFQGEIAIRNTGTAAVNGWTLAWAFPNGQRITNMWGATATQSGSSVSAAAASYTAVIAPGATVSVGFTASWTSANNRPSAFTLNSTPCTVV